MSNFNLNLNMNHADLEIATPVTVESASDVEEGPSYGRPLGECANLAENRQNSKTANLHTNPMHERYLLYDAVHRRYKKKEN
jgi:hypothetical protein